MKKIFVLLTIIISFLLINTAKSYVSVQQIRTFNNALTKHNVTVDHFDKNENYNEIIMHAAEINSVDIAYFNYSGDPFKQEVNLFLSTESLLDDLNMNRFLDAKTFNALPYSLSSSDASHEYYIKFLNSKINLTLIPIKNSTGYIDQNFFVTAKTEAQIDGFITSLKSLGIEATLSNGPNLVQTESLLRILAGLIAIDYPLFGFMLIYIVLLGHECYHSYRRDSILRLQGYTEIDILLEKIVKNVALFFATTVILSLIFTCFFSFQSKNIYDFWKAYTVSALMISLFLVLIIIVMQFLSSKTKQLDALRGKRNNSYFKLLLFLKTVFVIVLSIQMINQISQVSSLLETKEAVEKNSALYKGVYTLENKESMTFDLNTWIENNDAFYQQLSEDLTLYYAIDSSGDAYKEKIILMNNEYLNHLEIVDSKGDIISVQSKDEVVLISSKSNFKLTQQQLKGPLLCSFTGLDECSQVEIFSTNDDVLIPTIGDNADYIHAPFIIITGQKPQLFNDYNFRIDQDIDLETKLDKHLDGLPIRYKNLGTLHEDLNNAISTKLFALQKFMAVISLLLVVMIVSVYAVHYDIFKVYYSSDYMNGNSVYKISAPLFIFQVFINIIVLFVIGMIEKELSATLAVFMVTLIIELLSTLLVAQRLKRNIIRNIKGG